jgi:hypothetical protein
MISIQSGANTNSDSNRTIRNEGSVDFILAISLSSAIRNMNKENRPLLFTDTIKCS